MKRRDFLSGAAVAAAAGAIAQPALALKPEPMGAKVEALYGLRCQVDPIHADLIRQAGEQLGDDPKAKAALEALSKDLKQALTCPYCGCNLALGADSAPTPSRF